MSLTDYRALGRSGLIVSPLGLGTMTFGTARWGTNEDASRGVFDAYIAAGGNFIDTADVYSDGRSEELIGQFIQEHGLRESIVLATKAGFSAGDGLQAGGNGAKHMHAAINLSLRRLRTDYLDLYWVHVWDSVTPAEELLETMSNLVRSGKIRYWGISNAPAWYVAKIATLAAVRGVPGPIALQYFYSLVNRDIEIEHVPLAKEFGLGIVPWSPLAYGLLTGKYSRTEREAEAARVAGDAGPHAVAENRLAGANPFGDTLFTDRNWRIVDVLRSVAADLGESPARIALAWVMQQPGITTTLAGVSRATQLSENAEAASMRIPPDALAALDVVTQGDGRMLSRLFSPEMRKHTVFDGNTVRAWGE